MKQTKVVVLTGAMFLFLSGGNSFLQMLGNSVQVGSVGMVLAGEPAGNSNANNVEPWESFRGWSPRVPYGRSNEHSTTRQSENKTMELTTLIKDGYYVYINQRDGNVVHVTDRFGYKSTVALPKFENIQPVEDLGRTDGQKLRPAKIDQTDHPGQADGKADGHAKQDQQNECRQNPDHTASSSNMGSPWVPRSRSKTKIS